jgi:hypothetical protein
MDKSFWELMDELMRMLDVDSGPYQGMFFEDCRPMVVQAINNVKELKEKAGKYDKLE